MTRDTSRLLLVNYHYVRPADYRYSGIHPIEPAAFRDQVCELAARFHMASPEEVEAFAAGETQFERPAVFLTFDDGLLDHLLVAEILDHMGVKAAFFVSSLPIVERRAVSVHKVHWLRATTEPTAFRNEFLGLLEADQSTSLDASQRESALATYVYDTPQDAELKYLMNFMLAPERVDRVTTDMLANRDISEAAFCEKLYILDRKHLRGMADAGHVIGCHGHSHLPFATLGHEALADDVNASINCLEGMIGERPNWVSYPYGSPTAIPADPAAFCDEFGFSIGVTLKRDWNLPGQPASRLNRINTNEVARFVAA